MTLMDWLNLLALPFGLAALSAVTWAATHGAIYLRERAHNERLARLVDGIGRIAGDIQGQLQALPPGAGVAEVKAAAIAAGVADAKVRFDDTIASLGGASDRTIAGMITSALGTRPPPAIIVMPPDPVNAVRLPAAY